MTLMKQVLDAYGSSDAIKSSSKRTYIYHKRTKAPVKPSSLSFHLLSTGSISWVYKQQCKDKCLSLLSSAEILSIRRSYILKDQTERNLWIKNYVKNNRIKENKKVIGICWHLKGHDVCKYC